MVNRALKLFEEHFSTTSKKNLKFFSSCCGGITIWVLSCPTGDPLWGKNKEKAVKPFFIHSVLNCSHSRTTKRLSQQLNAYRREGWEITDIYFPYSSANTKSVCVCDKRKKSERQRESQRDWWGVCLRMYKWGCGFTGTTNSLSRELHQHKMLLLFVRGHIM